MDIRDELAEIIRRYTDSTYDSTGRPDVDIRAAADAILARFHVAERIGLTDDLQELRQGLVNIEHAATAKDAHGFARILRSRLDMLVASLPKPPA